MRQLPTSVKSLLAIVIGVAALAAIAVVSTPRRPANPALPADFLWGVASAGFQSEGNPPDSNWTRLSHSERFPDRVGGAVDFRHRYRDDIKLAKDLGVNVYRISVEWSRIEPKPGETDQTELAYYDDVVRAVQEAGMRPMITLDHWVYPGWVADQGGWTNPKTVDDWLANARRVVDRYQPANPLWVTINEPDGYLMQELQFHHLSSDQTGVIAERIVQAHNGAYDHIHATAPGALVTTSIAYMPGIEDQVDALLLDKMRLDYVGVDYYYGAGVPAGTSLAALIDNPALFESAKTPWTQRLEPEGVYYALRHYARRYPGKPLYIVENGMPAEDGKPRADGVTRARQIAETVYWVQRAKNAGMPVIGYNYWSLTDNYEWGSYHPRFGLYTIDVSTDPTLTRRPTDGVLAYQRIIAGHGVAGDYLPQTALTGCSQVDPPFSCDSPVSLPQPR